MYVLQKIATFETICYLLCEWMYCFWIKIGKKISKVVTFYRSTSQTKDDFETFKGKSELILDKVFDKNPFIVVALGDFNATSCQWYKQDKTTYEGSKIENLNLGQIKL